MEPAFHQQFTNMIYDIFHILFLLLFIYLSINILYLLFISIAGQLTRSATYPIRADKKNIAVLITSYKEDEVIVNTVRSAVNHDYAAQHFDVFIAADQLSPVTITEIKKLTPNIHEVNFNIGSKARSLHHLLNFIDENKYDIALILDGDNIMLPGFLEKVNAAFQTGCSAVQAHRTAKNINTPFAILDAISEEINNHLFRKAQSNLGFSASLIGSGMAFRFKKLKEIYNKPGITDNPACDREVDFELMKSGIRVAYLPDAHVLDEKVSTKKVYENQRRRWLESQLMHLSLFFSAKEKVPIKTKDYWNKLFINLMPPRSFMLIAFFIVFLVYLSGFILDKNFTGISLYLWAILFIIFLFSLFFSIPGRLLNFSTARAILYLPVILFSFIRAAITLRFKRKEFVHTPKTFTGNTGTTK